jgi:hypothetical protein
MRWEMGTRCSCTSAGPWRFFRCITKKRVPRRWLGRTAGRASPGPTALAPGQQCRGRRGGTLDELRRGGTYSSRRRWLLDRHNTRAKIVCPSQPRNPETFWASCAGTLASVRLPIRSRDTACHAPRPPVYTPPGTSTERARLRATRVSPHIGPPNGAGRLFYQR